MSKLNSIWLFISRFKYIVVVVVGVLCVGFVGNNSFYNIARLKVQIKDLRTQLAAEQAIDAKARQQLEDLDKNPKAIEHIAREKYMMKKYNEDIYVLKSDIDNKESEEE